MKIVLMIMAFVWWWPVGLAVLGFILFKRRRDGWRQPMVAGEQPMNLWNHKMDRWEHKMARAQQRVERVRSGMERATGRGGWFTAPTAPTSGNAAFDEYREETRRNPDEEQREFRDFLDRLRAAKDRAEFDQFMNERRNRPPAPEPPPAASPVA